MRISRILLIVMLCYGGSMKAQSWAVSTSGGCLLDRNSNVIAGSCQSDPRCSYVPTGQTRESRVCNGWIFFGICLGWSAYYTELEYRVECPLDEYIPVLFIVSAGLVCVFLRKKSAV
ncbi:hypothetical protein ACJVDH_14960 [Pedobacter sp. AW1-32]|uniref:hypothetical protein n=1 Tax=Pedobacter sp. AW1-32 TaxID=3383026 RepID=UPI003FF0BBA0